MCAKNPLALLILFTLGHEKDYTLKKSDRRKTLPETPGKLIYFKDDYIGPGKPGLLATSHPMAGTSYYSSADFPYSLLSKHRPSISRNVHMFVSVLTFEVPFKRLFVPTS